jgi:hypothetical protein
MPTGLLDILGLDPRPKRQNAHELAVLRQQKESMLAAERERGEQTRKTKSHELSATQAAALAAKFGIPVEQLVSFNDELKAIGASNIAGEKSNADAMRNRSQQIATSYGAGSPVPTMPPEMQKTLGAQQFEIENQQALKNASTQIGNPGAGIRYDTGSGPAKPVATWPYMGDEIQQTTDPLTGLATTSSVKTMQPGLPVINPEMQAKAQQDVLSGIMQNSSIFNRSPIPGGMTSGATPVQAAPPVPPALPPGLMEPETTQMQAPPTPQEVEAARRRRDMAKLVLPQGENIRSRFGKPEEALGAGRRFGNVIPQPNRQQDLGSLQQYLIQELARNPELAKRLGLQ